jgi:Planctomycete cytochrome C
VKLKSLRYVPALAFIAGATGCLDMVGPDVGEPTVGRCRPDDTDPAVDVSFHADIVPLFSRAGRDGGCGCHNPGGPGVTIAGLDFSNYDSLMRGGRNSGSSIVVAGDPCSSVLYLKVTEAPPFGARMPSSGPPFLKAEELRLVHDWIAEGGDED